MRIFYTTLCAILSLQLFAQTPEKELDTISKDTLSAIEEKTIDIIDESDDIEENKTLPLVKREGLYHLADDIEIANYDKKWLQELTNNDLSATMAEDVQTDYSTDVAYDELPTELLKSRLEILNQRTPFHVEYNPILERVIKSFLKNRRHSLERLMSLGTYYFPMFEARLKRKNIPLEMKYLPIVESGLNPRAKSSMGATGLWQFMYYTGKKYGLEVNNYVDERSDPLRSTTAAANFLSKLYEVFEDWDLVLAAYNSGPGNVTKAMRRSGDKKNYWNLRPYLPRETAGYVPAFLATLYIFEYAEEHGFKPVKRDNHFFITDTVRVKKHIPFKNIAEITGLTEEEIQFFNPSYAMKIIPYESDRKYALRLPMEDIGKFVANEDRIYVLLEEEEAKREKPLPKLVKGNQYSSGERIIYRVRKGDVIGKIALRYGVSIRNIKRWNRLRGNMIRIGQKLIIYK